MKVLVTGAGGLLAGEVSQEFRAAGWEVAAFGRDDLDVTDARAVARAMEASRPDIVFQGAAYTDVDAAETNEDLALSINAEGALNVARACQRVGTLFVYPSTDYVFSAPSDRPRRPSDIPSPQNAYGRSKLAGEAAARESGHFLILRTSWLYGSGGENFVQTVIRLARQREVLDIVDDQIGRPTWARSLARTLLALVERRASGIFHATDGGDPVSWYGLAKEIVSIEELSVGVRPVPSSHLARPAHRPSYSVLDCSETESVLGIKMPDWRGNLREYLSLGAEVAAADAG